MERWDVTVVGAGWAGLAAAVALAGTGARVQVLEAARRPGGRARRVRLGGLEADNGQHLLLGACRAVLGLRARLGLDPEAGFTRLPLRLRVEGPDGGPRLDLRLPSRLPPAPGLALALLRAAALGLPTRLAAVARLGRLRRAPAADADLPAARWLIEAGMPGPLRALLWEPLALAALNTPAREASARVLGRLLAEAFAGAGSADLLVPATDLGRLFPEPAVDWLRARGHAVRLGTAVTGIEAECGRISALRTRTQRLAVDGAVVLATAPWHTARLLAPLPGCAALARRLQALGSMPVTTVYLRYPEPVRLEPPILGVAGATVQWLFDRRLAGQRGLIAAVVSGPGPHMALRAAALARRVAAEVARLRPAWPPPAEVRTVRERRATFAARAGCEALRPGHATPLANLLLAGDHTATGLPATLEGAARSGLACARVLADGRP